VACAGFVLCGSRLVAATSKWLLRLPCQQINRACSCRRRVETVIVGLDCTSEILPFVGLRIQNS
jgi:hypothetical protein